MLVFGNGLGNAGPTTPPRRHPQREHFPPLSLDASRRADPPERIRRTPVLLSRPHPCLPPGPGGQCWSRLRGSRGRPAGRETSQEAG
jgi:hypothetical protein